MSLALAAAAVLAPLGFGAEAQVAKPRLWMLGSPTTPREKAIFAAIKDRLKVGFDLKLDTEGDLPRQGIDMRFLSQGPTTAVSVVYTAPRPPIALYRGTAMFVCGGTPTSPAGRRWRSPPPCRSDRTSVRR